MSVERCNDIDSELLMSDTFCVKMSATYSTPVMTHTSVGLFVELRRNPLNTELLEQQNTGADVDREKEFRGEVERVLARAAGI